jgi:arylsulfatase A-like enzyme
VLLLCLVLSAAACRQEGIPRFDNLVVVMVDTLRSDHLPSYGYERATAPYLERLAEEGIQLQGYSVTSWTKPSVATLLTGLHPQRHQAIGRSDLLPREALYLPEVLSRAGFSTACYIGNLNCGKKWGFERGFTRYRQWNGMRKVDGSRVTAGALSTVEGLKPPFFLYVHYVDPHDPYRPRVPWGSEAPPEKGYLQPQSLDGRGAPPTPEELQRLRDQYDGEILEVDREIERLVGELSRRGLMERTLLVVTADHGEELGEHGGLLHGRTLYEEVLKVPFLLWSPDGLPSRRSEEVFYQLDFMPTALEALGRPVPEGLDGLPRWREAVTGSEPQERDLFFHLDLEGHGALALLAGPWKLVHTNRPPFNRLTDLRRDPGETGTPLPEGEGSRRLFTRLIDHHNRLAGIALERRTTTLEPRLRRSLAALGYLQVDASQKELEARAVPDRLPRRVGLARPHPPSP